MHKNLVVGSLNVAGLKSPQRLLHVVNRLNTIKIDIIALQETTKNNNETKKIKKTKKIN